MGAQASGTENAAATQLRKQLATCKQRLSQYRSALNAGADAEQVAKWINETDQERALLAAVACLWADGARGSVPRMGG